MSEQDMLNQLRYEALFNVTYPLGEILYEFKADESDISLLDINKNPLYVKFVNQI